MHPVIKNARPDGQLSRRAFVGLGLLGLDRMCGLAATPRFGIDDRLRHRAAATKTPVRLAGEKPTPLAGEIGITTGSFMQHLRADRALHESLLLELPRRMKNELGLRVIDIMSETLASNDSAYVERLRSQVEQHGCVVTNLKLNQTEADLCSADPAVRARTMTIYRASIDVAHQLGCRWVRPALRGRRPDLSVLAAGFRELIDYAAPRGISLLVENQSWMRDDPDALPA